MWHHIQNKLKTDHINYKTYRKKIGENLCDIMLGRFLKCDTKSTIDKRMNFMPLIVFDQ